MYKYLLLLLMAFCFTIPVLSQEDTTDTEDDWDDWDEWEHEGTNHKWEDKYNFNVFNMAGSPTVSVNYGLANIEHHGFSGAFAKPRGVQLKIGYTDVDQVWQNNNIVENNFKFVSLSNITTDLSNISSTDPDYESNTWRIGLGRSSGYGYKLGDAALIFSSGGSLDWTRLKMTETPADSLDRNLTDLYNNTFRFGTSFEASVRLQIIRQISIEANYERAAVFPRHLFWKWLGSAVIENAAQFMIDQFVEEILDSSPYFAPVMGFLLKNGLNYGIYELRKEKMNWPFNSAAPLMYDQFKVGLTFVF
jgi:hypothetical protein